MKLSQAIAIVSQHAKAWMESQAPHQLEPGLAMRTVMDAAECMMSGNGDIDSDELHEHAEKARASRQPIDPVSSSTPPSDGSYASSTTQENPQGEPEGSDDAGSSPVNSQTVPEPGTSEGNPAVSTGS